MNSPRNSPRQLEIAEGFAEANSVFIVITSAKIFPRGLFPSEMYIQFTIFNLMSRQNYRLQTKYISCMC